MPKMTTAILCRVNAPLVTCAFDLIRRKLKVKIVGKDVAKQLKDLIGEILDRRPMSTPIETFIEVLNDWLAKIIEKYGDKDEKATYVAECQDLYGCLKVIAENSQSIRDMLDQIDSYFVDGEAADDDPSTITLCSGHRSKGLEWDRVIMLRPDLCPHPKATDPEDIEQEMNNKYVMLTRPMKVLWVCPDSRPD